MTLKVDGIDAPLCNHTRGVIILMITIYNQIHYRVITVLYLMTFIVLELFVRLELIPFRKSYML